MQKLENYWNQVVNTDLPIAKRLKNFIKFYMNRNSNKELTLQILKSNQNLTGLMIIQYFHHFDQNINANIYAKQTLNEILRLLGWYIVFNKDSFRKGWQFNAFMNIILKLVKIGFSNRIQIDVNKLLCKFIVISKPKLDNEIFEVVHKIHCQNLQKLHNIKQSSTYVVDTVNIPIECEFHPYDFLSSLIIQLLKTPFELEVISEKQVNEDCIYVFSILVHKICSIVFKYEDLKVSLDNDFKLLANDTRYRLVTFSNIFPRHLLMKIFHRIIEHKIKREMHDNHTAMSQLSLDALNISSQINDDILNPAQYFCYLDILLNHKNLIICFNSILLCTFKVALDDFDSSQIALSIYSAIFQYHHQLKRFLSCHKDVKKNRYMFIIILLLLSHILLLIDEDVFKLHADHKILDSIINIADCIFNNFSDSNIRLLVLNFISKILKIESIGLIATETQLKDIFKLFMQKWCINFVNLKFKANLLQYQLLYTTIMNSAISKPLVYQMLIDLDMEIFNLMIEKLKNKKNPLFKKSAIYKSRFTDLEISRSFSDTDLPLLYVYKYYNHDNMNESRMHYNEHDKSDIISQYNNSYATYNNNNEYLNEYVFQLFGLNSLCDIWGYLFKILGEVHTLPVEIIGQIISVYGIQLKEWAIIKNETNNHKKTYIFYNLNYKMYFARLLEILNNENMDDKAKNLSLEIICSNVNELYGNYYFLSDIEEATLFGNLIKILRSNYFDQIDIILKYMFSTVFYIDCKKTYLLIDNMLDCFSRPWILRKLKVNYLLAFYHNVCYAKNQFPNLIEKIDKFITIFTSEFIDLPNSHASFSTFCIFNLIIKSISNENEFYRDVLMLRNIQDQDCKSFLEALELLIISLNDSNINITIVTYILTLISSTIVNQGENVHIDNLNYYIYSKFIMILFHLFFTCTTSATNVYAKSIHYSMKILGEHIKLLYQANESNQLYFDTCEFYNWAALMINRHYGVTSTGNHSFEYNDSKEKIIDKKNLDKSFLIDNSLVQFYSTDEKKCDFISFESSSGFSFVRIYQENIKNHGLDSDILRYGFSLKNKKNPLQTLFSSSLKSYKNVCQPILNDLLQASKKFDFIDHSLKTSLNDFIYPDNKAYSVSENDHKLCFKSDNDIKIPTCTIPTLNCSIQNCFIATVIPKIDIKNKLLFVEENSKSKRDISYLSSLNMLETHKFGLLFIDLGQENESQIFANESASLNFNNFLRSLGIPMEKNGKKVFIQHIDATTSLEIHVSTILSTDDINKKKALIGNDMIHVVWSENLRKYDKDILRTQFADLIICIYPIYDNLFHIEFLVDEKIKYLKIGPLFNGAITDQAHLKYSLISTIICASRKLANCNDIPEPWAQKRIKAFESIKNKYQTINNEQYSSERFFFE